MWLEPDSAKMLDTLIERSGDRVSAVVARAIQALFDVTGNVVAEDVAPVTSRDPAVEELKAVMKGGHAVHQEKINRLIQWIRSMRDRKVSYEEMAEMLNEGEVPTLVGEGRWEKGMFPTILTINPEPKR